MGSEIACLGLIAFCLSKFNVVEIQGYDVNDNPLVLMKKFGLSCFLIYVFRWLSWSPSKLNSLLIWIVEFVILLSK